MIVVDKTTTDCFDGFQRLNADLLSCMFDAMVPDVKFKQSCIILQRTANMLLFMVPRHKPKT